MALKVANAPVSWGVFAGDAPTNPPWARVLDEIADAGYRWVELGPIGFLPEQPERLRLELERRRLQVAGTFLYEDLHRPERRREVVSQAERISDLLADVGARCLVVIDAMSPERMLTAGRSNAATRLDERRWTGLRNVVDEVARVAEQHGLEAVFHPHVGTYVEFEDEIDRLLGETGIALCVDTGHSAYAGVDAGGLVERYMKRVRYLHLKDIDGTVLCRVHKEALDFAAALAAGIFCPLGRGIVDFARLAELLKRIGFDGPATVEQDIDPASDVQPMVAARESLMYLRAMGLVA